MESKSLRIGNWIKTDFYGEFPIVGLSLLNEGNELFFKSLEYYPKSCKLKDVNPIPLTEEWIIKFGCTKDGEYLIKDRFKLIYRNDYNFWYVFDSLSDTYLTKIEFVHEWQNFFKVMNGTELTIK